MLDRQRRSVCLNACQILKWHAFCSVPLLFSDTLFLAFLFLSEVLETCMKNCGKRFHSEVGKFRFLNELIKVVSPKVRLTRPDVFVLFIVHFSAVCNFALVLNALIQYLGSRSPEPVKKKVLELIYSWTLGLPDEAKISDAYQMLKKQGKRQRSGGTLTTTICNITRWQQTLCWSL